MRCALSLLVILTACAHGPASDAPGADATNSGAPARPSAELFLVRHAEKATEPAGDPTLTPEGETRADDLARLLTDVPLVGIHSTDTTRTRATAAPTAAAKQLEVEMYDAIEELLAEVGAAGGGHLIVGHSNTLGDLVSAAGGDAGPPVGDTEFDRLYLVVLPAEGAITTVRLRYGQ